MKTYSLKHGRRAAGLAALGAVALLAACQASPATSVPPTSAPPAATETPVPPSPTAVLPATVTLPAPTATQPAEPTVTATPSPAVPPTPDPNLGVGDVLYEDKFDGAHWGWTFQDDAVTFGIAAGQLDAVMTRSDMGWRISSGPDLKAGDQQIQLTLRTNLCYEKDEYGLLFRNTNTPDFKFSGYLFKLSCGGQARVEKLRDSQPSVLLDWVASPAIQPGAPAENVLTVWAAKDQFNFYVNGKYIGSAADKDYADGDFGVYLRDRTNGGASVSFTALTIKEVKQP